MQRKATWASVVVVLLLAMGVAYAQQAQEEYLDVYTVQVKPEKRADFDAISKKIVAANRQNKGDNWLAIETIYGPNNRVSFVSTRHSYADIETATGAFMGAMQKAFGKPGTDKIFQDFSQCIISGTSELRRRRWDLSSNAPADAAAFAKMVGESRWLRTSIVHVRPGQVAAFEALLKDVKDAREKASPKVTAIVSQAVAGQEGTVFYVTTLQSSLAGYDAMPPIQQSLGNDGYEKFLKTSADTVITAETAINRFLPELSNAPEQIVATAPDYWRPKAAGIVNAKGAAKSPVVKAAETTKVDDKE